MVAMGYGNYIARDKILSVVDPETAPARRMLRQAKEEGKAIDMTQGKKCLSVIILVNGMIGLSANQTNIIADRYSKNRHTVKEIVE